MGNSDSNRITPTKHNLKQGKNKTEGGIPVTKSVFVFLNKGKTEKYSSWYNGGP